MEPFIFIAESALAYLISLAAGLRESAIGETAQKTIQDDLKNLGQQTRDREMSRTFEESIELIPISVAKLKNRLNDAYIDGPITKLCTELEFQKEISRYLLENDSDTRDRTKDSLRVSIKKAFLDAKATDEQAENNTDQFFDMIQRTVFVYPSLASYLLHRSVRHVISQNEQHSKKLDAIQKQLKVRCNLRIPLQRPMRAEHFTGREDELEKVLNDLKPGSVITLCGTGGLGKSALATEAVWRLAPDSDPPTLFPDGIVYHDFYTTPEVEKAFENVARSFGEEPEPSAMAAAQRALSNRRALLFLDGTEAADDLCMLLSVAGSCGVLITSQNKSDAVRIRVDLDPLTMPKALALIRAWCSSLIDDDTGRRICELLGGLPLALRLVGRYLNETSEQASDYLAWLQNSPLEALDHGERRVQSVPILFGRTIAILKEPSREALFATGLLALAPFTAHTVEATLDKQLTQVKRQLGELVKYGLLLKTSDNLSYVVSHRLIHACCADGCGVLSQETRRLASYYSALAKKLEQEGKAGYTLLESERAHMMRVVGLCKERNLWAPLIGLVLEIENFLDMQGYRSDQLLSLENGLKASKEIKDKRAESVVLGRMGLIYRSMGQLKKSVEYHQQALAVCREIGHREGESSQLGNLGNAYNDLGQVERAIAYYEKALVIDHMIRHHGFMAIHLGNLGCAYDDLGQAERAIEHHIQALLISREVGDRGGESIHLCNIGGAYNELGQVEKSIMCYEQALIISREIGDRKGESSELGRLGSAYHKQGKMEKAIESHEQALVISRKSGYRKIEARQLNSLGNAYRALGRAEKAIEYFEQALTIFHKIGLRNGEGACLGNLGSAYRVLGRVEKAIEYFEQALMVFRQAGYLQGEAGQLNSLGNVYRVLGKAEKAIEYFEKALIIIKKIGDRSSEGTCLGNLGTAYSDLDRAEKAIEYHEKSLLIAREIGDRRGESSQLGNIGTIYRELDQVEKAIEYHEKALLIACEIGDRYAEGTHLGNLGIAHCDLDQVEKAIEYHEKALLIAREIGDRQGEGNHLGNLGAAYYVIDQVEIAREYLKQSLSIFEKIKSPYAELVRKQLAKL